LDHHDDVKLDTNVTILAGQLEKNHAAAASIAIAA
jgi:hypothetical protein